MSARSGPSTWEENTRPYKGLTGCSYRRTARGRGWLSAGPAGAGRFGWRVEPCGGEWIADGATGLGVIYPVTSHL